MNGFCLSGVGSSQKRKAGPTTQEVFPTYTTTSEYRVGSRQLRFGLWSVIHFLEQLVVHEGLLQQLPVHYELMPRPVILNIPRRQCLETFLMAAMGVWGGAITDSW